MARFATPEDEWSAFLNGTHPHLQHGSPLRFIPSDPRCRFCKAPFGRPGAAVMRRLGFAPWQKNPKICGRCFRGLDKSASMCPGDPNGSEVRGAEVELSMLFADVRGSSRIAREMSTIDFTRLMDRFYRTSSEVLFDKDAIVEKFVGDEVVGLFIPCMTGPGHAARAVETARALFGACGYGSPGGPWVPLGAGVHTGTAFVGVVGGKGERDFTALGDAMNIAAHLASQAAAGEILVTGPVVERTELADIEPRHVSLKGYPLDVFVLPTRPAVAPAG